MTESIHHHVEPFARLLAQLDDPFADRSAVLHAAGLDEVACGQLRTRWTATFQQEPIGSDGQAQRFTHAYERTRNALRTARLGHAEDTDAAPPDPRFLSAEVQPWRAEAAAVLLHAPLDAAAPIISISAPTPLLPVGLDQVLSPSSSRSPEPLVDSPWTESPWIPAGMRHLDNVQATQIGSSTPQEPALPFDPSAPSALASTPVASMDSLAFVPKGMQRFEDVTGTQLVADAPASPTLPFATVASSPDPAPADANVLPPGLRNITDLGGTQGVAAASPVEPVLPFDPFAAPQLPAAEAPAWLPKGMRGFADVGGTQLDSGVAQAPAMPFDRTAPLPKTASPASPPLPLGKLDATLALPQKGESLPVAPLPTPASRSVAAAVAMPVLSVEQYASLGIELDLHRARRPETLQRYRITEQQWNQLQAHWGPRLAGDAPLRASWEGACAAYRAWLLQNKSESR